MVVTAGKLSHLLKASPDTTIHTTCTLMASDHRYIMQKFLSAAHRLGHDSFICTFKVCLTM